MKKRCKYLDNQSMRIHKQWIQFKGSLDDIHCHWKLHQHLRQKQQLAQTTEVLKSRINDCGLEYRLVSLALRVCVCVWCRCVVTHRLPGFSIYGHGSYSHCTSLCSCTLSYITWGQKDTTESVLVDLITHRKTHTRHSWYKLFIVGGWMSLRWNESYWYDTTSVRYKLPEHFQQTCQQCFRFPDSKIVLI